MYSWNNCSACSYSLRTHIFPVGDKGPGEVRYHTTHHLVCKAVSEVLLEGSRRCCWFIATTFCNTLCSIHCIIDPLLDRLKLSIFYKRCCQLFLDVGETTTWVFVLATLTTALLVWIHRSSGMYALPRKGSSCHSVNWRSWKWENTHPDPFNSNTLVAAG